MPKRKDKRVRAPYKKPPAESVLHSDMALTEFELAMHERVGNVRRADQARRRLRLLGHIRQQMKSLTCPSCGRLFETHLGRKTHIRLEHEIAKLNGVEP